MSERIWSDINQPTKMRNRDLPVFPVTTIHQTETEYNQGTVGGFTKLEQGAFLIAQGLAKNELISFDEVARLSVKIANDIFDSLEQENK